LYFVIQSSYPRNEPFGYLPISRRLPIRSDRSKLDPRRSCGSCSHSRRVIIVACFQATRNVEPVGGGLSNGQAAEQSPIRQRQTASHRCLRPDPRVRFRHWGPTGGFDAWVGMQGSIVPGRFAGGLVRHSMPRKAAASRQGPFERLARPRRCGKFGADWEDHTADTQSSPVRQGTMERCIRRPR
jgi:hypothetical protein